MSSQPCSTKRRRTGPANGTPVGTRERRGREGAPPIFLKCHEHRFVSPGAPRTHERPFTVRGRQRRRTSAPGAGRARRSRRLHRVGTAPVDAPARSRRACLAAAARRASRVSSVGFAEESPRSGGSRSVDRERGSAGARRRGAGSPRGRGVQRGAARAPRIRAGHSAHVRISAPLPRKTVSTRSSWTAGSWSAHPSRSTVSP